MFLQLQIQDLVAHIALVQLGDAKRPPVDEPESISLPQAGQFATLLSLNQIKNLSGLLEMAEQTGRLKVLAEPNLMAANRERASFLAGGELPVPIAQPVGVSGVQAVTIQYREFGIRLDFVPEILSRLAASSTTG